MGVTGSKMGGGIWEAPHILDFVLDRSVIMRALRICIKCGDLVDTLAKRAHHGFN